MSGETDGDDKTEPTFTRAQMAKMVAAQVREKVSTALAEYGDLDELKRKAAGFDSNEGKLDQVLSKLAAAEKRAEAAELDNARASVAAELGLKPSQAKRLNGKTRAELLEDGRELLDDLGIKPDTKGAAVDDKGTGTGTESEEHDEEGAVEQDEQEAPKPPAQPARMRPRETLRSGAPRTQTAPEETNPLKLADMIPRR